MIHSILLIGQSNAAGRGYLSEAKPLENPDWKLLVLRNGRWQPMFRPVNPDRNSSGTCLAESFARAYLDSHQDVHVGVIPCADGGTNLNQWKEGDVLFDHALFQAKLAQRTSKIVAVIWHQGESDCNPDFYPYYQEKFEKIMNAFRRELNLEKVPFLIGGLGDFLKDYSAEHIKNNYPIVNDALKKIALDNEYTAFVSAKGLSGNPDNIHFSAKALDEFGIRYFEEFKKFEQEISTENIDGRLERSEIELL